MAGGRPTDYNKSEVAKAVTKYVKDCRDQHYLPTIEGLAVHLEVGRQTLYNWAETYPEFFDILERLKTVQASQLIQNGLKGEYNSTITKLMLSKHGYIDKQDITSDNKPIAPLMVRFLGDDQPDNGHTEGV